MPKVYEKLTEQLFNVYLQELMDINEDCNTLTKLKKKIDSDDSIDKKIAYTTLRSWLIGNSVPNTSSAADVIGVFDKGPQLSNSELIAMLKYSKQYLSENKNSETDLKTVYERSIKIHPDDILGEGATKLDLTLQIESRIEELYEKGILNEKEFTSKNAKNQNCYFEWLLREDLKRQYNEE